MPVVEEVFELAPDPLPAYINETEENIEKLLNAHDTPITDSNKYGAENAAAFYFKSEEELMALAEKQGQDLGDLNDGEIDRADPADIKENIEKAQTLIQEIPIDPYKSPRENMAVAKEKAGITCKWANDTPGGNYQVSHDGSVWRCCWHKYF